MQARVAWARVWRHAGRWRREPPCPVAGNGKSIAS